MFFKLSAFSSSPEQERSERAHAYKQPAGKEAGGPVRARLFVFDL
jgi:hypothetical protein